MAMNRMKKIDSSLLHLMATVPDEFDYINPLAEFLFQFLLVELTKYEVMIHLKRVRENKIYTIRDCVLSDITCDDSGAHNKTNKVKHDYYVIIMLLL